MIIYANKGEKMTIKSTILILSAIFLFVVSCSKETLKEKADRIHENIVSIDTHCDTPLNFLKEDFDIGKWNDLKKTRTLVDFPRMKAGKLDAVFMAVYLGQGPRTEEGNKEAKEKALEIFSALQSKIGAYPELATIVTSPDDVYKIKKEGKRAVYIGIENGYPIGKDINSVKEFYDLGARYITLCHIKNNDICDSSTDKLGPEYNGLSEFGEEVVKEMNRLGIMVDVSHISDSSFFDVIKLSKTPVIASHSSIREICGHPRNFSDDMLDALKENNGVIQICMLNSYLIESAANARSDSAFNATMTKYNYFKGLSDDEYKAGVGEMRSLKTRFPKDPATVSIAVDHIDYVVNRIGIDHVGIGTDFDGGGGLEDCKDHSEMENFTLELLKRGYSEEDIKKIWGENFLRVFREVEKAARI